MNKVIVSLCIEVEAAHPPVLPKYKIGEEVYVSTNVTLWRDFRVMTLCEIKRSWWSQYDTSYIYRVEAHPNTTAHNQIRGVDFLEKDISPSTAR